MLKEGEAIAFYGPKLDIQAKNVHGKRRYNNHSSN